MTDTIRVDVTAEHIAVGRPCNSALCPVAYALFEATGEKWLVSGHFCCINDKSDVFFYPPPWLEARICAFDRGDSMQPFTFRMVPEIGGSYAIYEGADICA